MNTLITILRTVYLLPYIIANAIIFLFIIAYKLNKTRGITFEQKIDYCNELMKQHLVKQSGEVLLSYLFSTVIWVCIFA